MGTRRAIIAAALAVLAATANLVAAPPAHAATVSQPLRTAIADLPVAAERRTGYDRDLFPHWLDADGDGCHARNEVLLAEATRAPSIGSRCRLTGGRWYSYYDNAAWTDATDLDVDHVVALAEAWDSGARTWTTARRRSYANDLGDDRTLEAVTDDVNQAKGDRDPAAWMPPHPAAQCRYVGAWVAVKIRWRLTVDQAEKDALTGHAGSCPNVTITVTQAG
jgi:hypothetical protein